MKMCPNCQKEYGDISAFCAVCGSQLTTVQAPVEEPQVVAPTVKYCIGCGNQLDINAAFCPACGTPVNSVNGAPVKSSINVNDYINKIKTNKNVTGFVGTLKKYIKNPVAELENISKAGDVVTTLIFTALLLISIIVYFLCFVGKLSDEFYGSFQKAAEMCVLSGVLIALFFVLVPAIVTFAVAKINHKQCAIKGMLSVSAVNTIYLVPLFVIAGLSAYISIELSLILFAVVIVIKAFLSISMLNNFAGNILESVKILFSSVGIAIALDAVAILICGSILSSALENIIYDLIYSFIW